MPTPSPNILEELMLLARNAANNVQPMQSIPADDGGDYPDLLEYRGESNPGRYTPDMFSPEGKYIRDALNINRDTQPPLIPTTQPPATMAQRPVSQPNATPTGDEMPQPVAEKTTEQGYEEWMKYFKNTLPPEPEMDTKKRNQLATVAAINALGGMLKNVVDLKGKGNYGSPIGVRQDVATPTLLAQYEREGDEYQQRKDRYDLTKTNTMQQALQYAYGDEKAREQYEKQLDLQGKSQAYQSAENEKERAARAALAKEQADMVNKRDDKQYGQDMEKLKKNYEYESKLIGQRNSDAIKAIQGKYNPQTAQKQATALAKKSIQVVDPDDVNKPITIPPHIYLDILQKQIALQNADFTEFLTSTDFNATNNAGDIMVAKYWNDYYDVVRDAAGNTVAFTPKGIAGGAVPAEGGAGDIPEWFK